MKYKWGPELRLTYIIKVVPLVKKQLQLILAFVVGLLNASFLYFCLKSLKELADENVSDGCKRKFFYVCVKSTIITLCPRSVFL